MDVDRRNSRRFVAVVFTAAAAAMLTACTGQPADTAPDTPTTRETITLTAPASPTHDATPSRGSLTSPGPSTPDETPSASMSGEPGSSAQTSPTSSTRPPGPTVSTSVVEVDTGHVVKRDPKQVAAAFVTDFAERSHEDSQANNYALRTAPLATTALQQRMIRQVSTDPAAIPSFGETHVTVNAVVPMPAVTSKTVRGYRVVYTVRRFEQETEVGELTGVTLNCTLARQSDGTWLVDSVAYGAN